MFGASKSCFIACPTHDELETILGLMSEKLTKIGIEPIIAVKERAYGQDIFCTKICGKIIEARFCIVILDDTVKSETNVPNPNVYYEYGIMTALHKHVIPLQRDDLKLAFNIQSHDTIKYNSRNLTTELDLAIKDAVRLTEAKDGDKTPHAVADKVILRRLEMAGFVLKDQNWFLSDAISDTSFRGFGQHDKGFYAYISKIDSIDDMQTCLDDLSIVLHRTDKLVKTIHQGLNDLERERQEQNVKEQLAALNGRPVVVGWSPTSPDETIAEMQDRLELMTTIFIGVIIKNELDSSEFLRSVATMIEGRDRYRLSVSENGKMAFGEVMVDFISSQR